MNTRVRRIKALLLLHGFVVCACFLATETIWGQTQTLPTSTSTSTGNNQSPPASPTITSGSQLGDIFFRSRNSLIFSLNADETYQDNAYYTGLGDQIADYSTRLTGRMAYQREQGRTTTGLDFSFGRLIYNRSDRFDQYIADGGLDLTYRATPRWTITLGDRVGYYPQAGNFLRSNSILNPLPPQQAPNNSILLPLNQSIMNTVHFSSNYLMSRRSGLTFSASNSINIYDQADLRDQNSSNASIGYSYQLSRRNSLQVVYQFGYYYSANSTVPSTGGLITSANLVRSHMAYMGITRQFSPSLMGSMSGGVISMISDSIDLATGNRYRPSPRPIVLGNITYSPTFDPRAFLSLQAGQNVANGSGLGSFSLIQSATASLGRRFTRKITGSIEGGYSRNQFLSDIGTSGQPSTTNGFYGGARLSIYLTERLNLFANYQRFQQTSTGFSTVIPGQMNGNIATVGIGYSFPWFY
jgi:hypothetical protein